MQLVVFRLAGEQYALPIGQVREIIRSRPPRRLPNASPSMQGVIDLRGRIVPVFDLAGYLGCPALVGAEGKIVIAESDRGAIGLSVDDVDAVLTVADDAVDPRTPYADARVHGIAKTSERLVVILDAERLFGDTAIPAAVELRAA